VNRLSSVWRRRKATYIPPIRHIRLMFPDGRIRLCEVEVSQGHELLEQCDWKSLDTSDVTCAVCKMVFTVFVFVKFGVLTMDALP
jgi:hypothetical protein